MVKIVTIAQVYRMFKGCTLERVDRVDNDQLESKGVAALGARRKLLKAFDVVKNNLPVV